MESMVNGAFKIAKDIRRNWLKQLIMNEIFGHVFVRYCRAPMAHVYNVGSVKGSPENAESVVLTIAGVALGLMF